MTDYNLRNFGTSHPACGRCLPVGKTAGLEDADYLKPHAGIEPVRHVIEGANAYARRKGLADPHDGSIDYHKVMTHAGLLKDLGHAYDRLPHDDPQAHRHFDAMRDEVRQQHDFMTHHMGIRTEVTSHDPYKDVHELAADVRDNHRIKVLGTHATGDHPYFSHEDNDKFRAVHDVFGHLGTGRSFDAHGEEATYQAHARMFSKHARPALTSETRGQNGSLHLNGGFGAQRIAVLPHRLHAPGLAHFSSREELKEQSMDRIAVLVSDSPFKIVAHVSGNQVDILHCPFCGSGAVIGRSDGTIECGFCTSVFTVQTQPQYNGMPQSVDGQPYQWPGMPDPAGVAAPDMPGGTNLNPNTNGEMDPGMDPSMDPNAGGSAPPFQSSDPADGGDEEEDGDDDDKPAFLKGKGDSKSDKKDDKKKGDNPFAKKKSYRTATGRKLDEADYLAHLAIMHANDQSKVATMVKAARKG